MNLNRTKEIVFRRPHPTNYLPPAKFNVIERVGIAKLLGVRLQNDMGAENK